MEPKAKASSNQFSMFEACGLNSIIAKYNHGWLLHLLKLESFGEVFHAFAKGWYTEIERNDLYASLSDSLWISTTWKRCECPCFAQNIACYVPNYKIIYFFEQVTCSHWDMLETILLSIINTIASMGEEACMKQDYASFGMKILVNPSVAFYCNTLRSNTQV